MMNASFTQGAGSSATAGAFAGSVYDEVAGYSAGDTLARQLSQKLVYSARRGVRRLKMNLTPESLGQLTVELKVTGNKLTASIRADSLEAYQALEKEVMALRDTLSAEGIELKLTLTYAGADDSGKYFAEDGSEYQLGLSVPQGEEPEEEENAGDGDEWSSGPAGGGLFSAQSDNRRLV